MSSDDDPAPVRIEIEQYAPQMTFVPGGSAEPRRRTRREQRSSRLAAAIAIISIIAIALVYALLRPDDGQTAAGDDQADRSEVEGVEEAPSTTIFESVTIPPPLRAFATTVEDLKNIEGIVLADPGYLAMGLSSDRPAIYRSATGANWELLPTTVVDSDGAALEKRAGDVRSFSALGAAGDAFFITMHDTMFGDASRTPVAAVSTRLRSSDGVVWQVDPGFTPIEARDGWIVPFMNTGELTGVAILRPEAGNPLIERILERFATDNAIIDGCWLGATPLPDQPDAVASLQPCLGETATILLRSQLEPAGTVLGEPVDGDAFGECLGELVWRSGPPLEVVMARRDQTTVRRYNGFGASSSLPVVSPSGGLAILDPGRSLRGAPSCRPFEPQTADAPVDPGVLFLEPGTGSRRIPSRGQLPKDKLFGLGSPMVVTEAEVFVPLESGVYRLDRESREWSEVARSVSSEPIWIDERGERLFTFGDGLFHVAAVGEEWTRVEIDQVVEAQALLHADDSIAFFAADGGVVLIEVPTIEPS